MLPLTPDVIPIGGSDLRAMTMDSTARYLYISDYALGTVHRINLETEQLDSVGYSTEGNPTSLALSRDGRVLIAATLVDADDGAIEVIDLSNPNNRTKLQLNGAPTAVAALKDGRVFVSTDAGGIWQRHEVNIRFDPDSAISVELVEPPISDRIVGASHSGRFLLTEGNTVDARLTVSLWDTSQTPMRGHDLGDLFGSSARKPGRIAVSDDDRELFIFTDGSATQAAHFPSCVLSENYECVVAARIRTTFLPNAFAVSPVTGLAVIAHDPTTENQWMPTQHDLSIADLHVFDTTSGEQVGTVELQDHVRDNGLLTGPDGRIYLLLGSERASAVSIIEPP